MGSSVVSWFCPLFRQRLAAPLCSSLFLAALQYLWMYSLVFALTTVFRVVCCRFTLCVFPPRALAREALQRKQAEARIAAMELRQKELSWQVRNKVHTVRQG